MAFELHIWGPAFGLPSIDAECIAASAYMNQLFIQEEWNLIIAHDPSHSPTGDFPMLRHELQWIGGFSAIVEYLAGKGYSLDTELSPRQRSDSIAIQAHLAANAQPLLDATLYASSSNYSATIRPAWTKILPPHANFVVPPRRHAIAKSRTLPLGLSSGSVDDLPTSGFPPQQEQEARMLSSSPSLIFKKRQTLQDAMKTQQNRTLFRLESLTDTLMEPLARMLNGKKYLLCDEEEGPSSIDCLALGYLALLIFPDVPHAWVTETIGKKFKNMVDYVRDLQTRLLPEVPYNLDALTQNAPFESDTDANQIKHKGELSQQPTTTLWRKSEKSTPMSIFRALSNSLLANIISPLQQHFIFESDLLRNSPPTALRSWISPLALFLTLSGPIFATLSYMLYAQTHLYPEQQKRFGRPIPRFPALTMLDNRQWGNMGPNLGSSSPIARPMGTGKMLNNQMEMSDSALDGQAKLRQDQDSPAFSEKPGVSVEIVNARGAESSSQQGGEGSSR